MGGSVSPGVAKLVSDASVWKLAQSLGRDRAPCDIAKQSLESSAVVGFYRDACMKAETLYAGTTLSRDEVDILCFDAIPESHDRLACASTGRNAVLQ